MNTAHFRHAMTVLALSASAAFAQQKMDDMKGMDMAKKPATSANAPHKTKATVKKVDEKAGTVMLSHEPVASLNWPAMTMAFKVRDKNLMAKLSASTSSSSRTGTTMWSSRLSKS